MKLVRDGTTLSETDYAYDSITRRLATVTINGQTFTYSYKPGTNLIDGITVDTSFGYGATNGLLTSIATGTEGTSLYSASYTYNQLQQRQTDTVTQANPDGSTTDTNWTYGYDNANELTSVKDTSSGSTLYSYNYDGAGNQTGTSMGAASTMNQYANYTYNARGDLTSDGVMTYTWDAKDELASETPVSPTSGSTKLEFQYDAEGRRTRVDTYNWNATAGEWDSEPDKTLKYAYQGSNLVGEFDGDNNLLVSLTRIIHAR